MLGFTQSHFYLLDDIQGFHQLIAGSYESDKSVNIPGIDKIHIKADCNDGSIVNGIRGPILYNFALDKPPGHKAYKEPTVKLFKEIKENLFCLISLFI